MVYTNIELRNAFLEMRGYNEERDGTQQEFLTKIETEIQARIDQRLAEIPANARVAMKQQAVEYLANKEATQIKLDNQGGEL